MRRCLVVAVCLAGSLAAGPAPAGDQSKPDDKPAAKPAEEAGPRGPTTFRGRLTAHRQVGDKKVESVPYEFLVQEGLETELRVGTEVPVPVTTFSAVSDKSTVFSPATSVQYKNVGVSIDCRVSSRGVPPATVSVRLKMEFSTIVGKSDFGSWSLPQFGTTSATLQLLAKLGEVYQVANMRPFGTNESLVWDFELQPLR